MCSFSSVTWSPFNSEYSNIFDRIEGLMFLSWEVEFLFPKSLQMRLKERRIVE